MTGKGVVKADVCEVRFAYSGKVVWIGKKAGDVVKKGEAIASLDRKVLQTELDRQLADYEKVRADFELFRLKFGDGGDDTTKYTRQEKQSALNASVKDVELAKYKLDDVNLTSPVNGTIMEMEGFATGLNITPASNPVKIINRDSLCFVYEVAQEELATFLVPVKVKITFSSVNIEREGMTTPPFYGKDGSFPILVTISDPTGLLPGMKGEVTLP